MTAKDLPFDEIGYWSEIKLDIIKEYAAAYSKILSAQNAPGLYHIYIDAFAGAGVHLSKSSGEFVPGSPTNALLVNPPFREYHFIDLNEQKVTSLEKLAKNRADVHIHHGDCNHILLDNVLPLAKYESYRRARECRPPPTMPPDPLRRARSNRRNGRRPDSPRARRPRGVERALRRPELRLRRRARTAAARRDRPDAGRAPADVRRERRSRSGLQWRDLQLPRAATGAEIQRFLLSFGQR